MSFNTAIFYDIENLLKGYSFSQQIIANLSLAEILGTIRETGQIGQVAVQRAYANWSDPRLAIMRGEINELGIDPIQVFGFAKEQKKNAADIQLAIDAVDLAHARPALEVFVIISGDGGFASLAKKLHEYGRTVIGCAYRSAANKTFQSVCDEFVWITDPDEEERQERPRVPTSCSPGQPDVTDPRNVRLARRLKPATDAALDSSVQKTREVLDWYAQDAAGRADLLRAELYLSVVQEAVRFVLPQFQPIRFGFAKFIEFMQYVCTGTEYCIVRPPHSQAVLALRPAVRGGAELLPDLEAREVHSPETYQAILAVGAPIFRLPTPADLGAVVAWVADHPADGEDLGTVIEGTVAGLDGTVSSEAVKLAVLSLLSAGAFEREPEGVSLSEQKLRLRGDLRSAAGVIGLLKAGMTQKLQSVLDDVAEQPVAGLLPDLG